jgi:hypothetical protein
MPSVETFLVEHELGILLLLVGVWTFAILVWVFYPRAKAVAYDT